MTLSNIGDIIAQHAREAPNREALADANNRLTYKTLDNRTDSLALALNSKHDLRKGDRLGILAHNCAKFFEVYIAATKAGIVTVPISFRATPVEVEYILLNSGAKALIYDSNTEKCAEDANSELSLDTLCLDSQEYERCIESSSSRPYVEINSECTMIIPYTSGTTGDPKGVVRSFRSHNNFHETNIKLFNLKNTDRTLIVMPQYHINSVFFGLTALAAGGKVYVHGSTKFNPEDLLQIIDREKITFTSLIPLHYKKMLSLPQEVKKKYDLSSMEKILCSSERVHVDMKKEIMKLFPSAGLWEAYGSTEGGIVTVLGPKDQIEAKAVSIGLPVPGAKVKIIDDETRVELPSGKEGQIAVNSPMVCDRYYLDSQKTRAAQVIINGLPYFMVGDNGYKDADGYVYITGRKDDMIITGGEHVYPSDVEPIIAQHPSVESVGVVGLNNDQWGGEAVAAIVVAKKGAKVSQADIISFCEGKMAGHKKPKTVIFVDEIPCTPSGKVMHRELRYRCMVSGLRK